MANGASVNVLRSPYCSETQAGFQPAWCTIPRWMIPATVVESILLVETGTTGGEMG